MAKSLNLFIILLIATVTVVRAQMLQDTIPFRQVILNGQINFSTREDVLNQFCGEPDSIIKRIDECDDDRPYYLNYYGPDVFEIKDHTIRAFTIRSLKFRLKFQDIAVGDPEEVLKKAFPNAYRQRTMITEDEYRLSVFVGQSDQKLFFSVKNGRIIEFRSFFPC